jgi:hypothetical protein
VWDLISAVDSRSNGRRRRERGKLTGEGDSGEGAQVVDGEGAPVISGGEEYVDGVQVVEANSRAWTSRSIASSRGREEQLEMRRAEVSFRWQRRHRFAASLDKGRAPV